MKTNALFITCAQRTHSGETEGEHSMLDNCWNCAPYWWQVPVCPFHNFMKLNTSGFCKACKKFYKIDKIKN